MSHGFGAAKHFMPLPHTVVSSKKGLSPSIFSLNVRIFAKIFWEDYKRSMWPESQKRPRTTDKGFLNTGGRRGSFSKWEKFPNFIVIFFLNESVIEICKKGN